MSHSSDNLTKGYKAITEYVVSSFTLKCAEYGEITDLKISFSVQS
jgi:hypothetical protein